MDTRQNFLNNPLASDLDHILSHTEKLWEALRGKRIFITGGTGFFGCWILESFASANTTYELGASATVLTRDYEAFRKKAPHLAGDPAIKFLIGKISDFKFSDEKYSYILHAAAPTTIDFFTHRTTPAERYRTIVEGTRHVLDFAVKSQAEKFLFTSSGAVYGKPPPEMAHIPENYQGVLNPADPYSAWGESKREAESLCATYADRHGIQTNIARCFTFVGPYLLLDVHYAIGNFILDGLQKKPIVIRGDGSAYRSYLYAADLAIWLWTILFLGKNCRPYNVGSEEAIDIYSLAKTVSKMFQPALEVKRARPPEPNTPTDRYVPSTQRAQSELRLRQTVSLKDSIARTIAWNKSQISPK